MKKRKSLLSFIYHTSLFFIISISFLFILLTIATNLWFFEEDKRLTKNHYIQKRKIFVRDAVEKAVKEIKKESENLDKKTKEILKYRVSQVCKLSKNYYEKNKNKKDRATIIKEIKTFLRPIRAFYGTSYFFAVDFDGTELLFPIKPELEGKKLLKMKSMDGKFVVKDMLNIVKTKGEGFYSYKWKKPGKKEWSFNKLSFVKKVDGLNIFIGMGVYEDDYTKILKEDILKRISAIRYGKDGYIFVNKYNGETLLSNGKLSNSGTKLWERFGSEAEKIFKKELKAAKNPKGEFISYSWQKLTNSKKVSPKISFIRGIKKWKWIIGAGVYVDNINDEIVILQQKLKYRILFIAFIILLIALFSFVTMMFIFFKLDKFLQKDRRVFVSFFKKASEEENKIDSDNLIFNEFFDLSNYANQMIDKKNEIQKKLEDEKKELSLVLKNLQEKEKELIKTKNRFEILFESVPIPLLELDYSDFFKNINLSSSFSNFEATFSLFKKIKIISCNNSALKLFEVKNLEELVKNIEIIFKELMTPEYLTKQLNLLKQNQARFSEEVVFYTKTGKKIDAMVSKTPIENNELLSNRILISIVDITNLKKMQQQNVKMHNLESLALLAGGIAHDFNNLLTGIYGNVSLAKINKNNPEVLSKYLFETENSMQRAVALTKQLLTFAKGGMPVKELIEIKDVVLKTAEFSLRGSSIELLFEVQKDLWKVSADKGQISQVVSNIVINAVHAMESHGKILISLSNFDNSEEKIDLDNKHLKQGKFVKIEIKDTGKGIPKDKLQHIFDPYFTTKSDGNGLGLSIVYSIIQRHGGFIEVFSKENQGTTFELYLPICEMISDSEENSSDNLNSEDFEEKKLEALKVLIMDDEPIIRDLLKEMIETLDFECVATKNGEEAIEEYKKAKESGFPFDLIITDLTVQGGMGGKETVAELLKIDKSVKVIVASGYSMDIGDYEKFGFVASINKPFSFDSLRKTIYKVMG